MKQFDTGRKFGLQPIGTSGIDSGAPANDTERRQFPGLATKSSVMAWRDTFATIFSFTGTPTGTIVLINLRNNTATGGSSVDVPSWAAGAVISVQYQVTVMGGGVTQQNLTISPSFNTNNTVYAVAYSALPTELTTVQCIVPFYDEPIVGVVLGSAGAVAGTVSCTINLNGFVRNV